MATHVICLDGTGQQKIQQCPTNIARIFDSLGGQPVDAGNGSFEVSIGSANGKYLPGVGSPGSGTLSVLGNLFGDGIAELIIRGYTFISRVYQPGDAIIIVGFSRGATAARALAGLIVARGPLDPAKYDVADKEQAYRRAVAAWYLYRTGRADLANQARLHQIEQRTQPLPALLDTDFIGATQIAAVGVFDTVSSLGLPHIGADGPVFDFSICDTTLSDKVVKGFHALAADETRELFTPTFWAARNDVEQQIFPGCHSDVGGGYPERGLADCVLEWMTGRLNSVAALFDLARIPGGLAPNIIDLAHDETRKLPYMLTPSRARAFPKEASLNPIVGQRLGKTCTIVPGFVLKPYAPRGRYADGTELILAE
jgi:glutathione S-transferase